jgi:predicted signal transduction protein with EAL and GGDEF domain
VSFEVLASNQLYEPSVAGIVLTMRDVSERRALEHQLTQQAFHDPLTGLPNRLLFYDRAEQALTRARVLGTTVAIVMIDVDGFKKSALPGFQWVAGVMVWWGRAAIHRGGSRSRS